jgi:hypothetical protein
MILRQTRDGHVVIIPPLTASERERIVKRQMSPFIYDQAAGIESAIQGRRTMFAEARARGDREVVDAVVRANRLSLGL